MPNRLIGQASIILGECLAYSYHAEEGGQAPGDLACIAAREQRQITTAGLVPAGLPRLRISPGHSGASRLTRPGHRRIVAA